MADMSLRIIFEEWNDVLPSDFDSNLDGKEEFLETLVQIIFDNH